MGESANLAGAIGQNPHRAIESIPAIESIRAIESLPAIESIWAIDKFSVGKRHCHLLTPSFFKFA
ncbi:hypothetical protein QUA40_09030 [Microcoleus sp. Pol11C3]|uniref:hypothetical protein n=1 Tax=Microcoleus sp. Pol11C3 TaxID=3055390 RepID=UPI002FD674A2